MKKLWYFLNRDDFILDCYTTKFIDTAFSLLHFIVSPTLWTFLLRTFHTANNLSNFSCTGNSEPSKHKTLAQSCFNAGPLSTTLNQQQSLVSAVNIPLLGCVADGSFCPPPPTSVPGRPVSGWVCDLCDLSHHVVAVHTSPRVSPHHVYQLQQTLSQCHIL